MSNKIDREGSKKESPDGRQSAIITADSEMKFANAALQIRQKCR